MKGNYIDIELSKNHEPWHITTPFQMYIQKYLQINFDK